MNKAIQFIDDGSNSTLAYFVAVVQEAGFSQAADKFGKSQSVVSTQVGLFEKELNLKLLDRKKGPVGVTEAGSFFGMPRALDALLRSYRRVNWNERLCAQ